MPQLRPDLLFSVIECGIKRPIELLLSQCYYPAALVLAYSGMDTMAFLNMPAAKTDVMRSDFIAWAEQYMVLPAHEDITGRDLYAARCSVLHGGAHSRLSRGGDCKLLLHFANSAPADNHQHAIALAAQLGAGKPVTRLSVEDLVSAFFSGTDRFLTAMSNDERKLSLVEQRLEYLIETSPYSKALTVS